MSAPTLAIFAGMECDCPGPEFCGHAYAHRAQVALDGYLALVDEAYGEECDADFYNECPECGECPCICRDAVDLADLAYEAAR